MCTAATSTPTWQPGSTSPKLAPAEVVGQTIDALVAGRSEVIADEVSRRVRAGLSGDLEGLYPELG